MSYHVRQTFPSLKVKAQPLAHAMAAASMLSVWPLAASPQALPGGLNVASGQAQVSTSGSAMTVTNSANAILNWQSFSIGSGASVRFNQASSSGAVLNRVVGNDPSSILGSLSSNGRVWLLNPNGILFGQGARVDVAGLVASTLRLNDHDWLAGRFNLFAEGSATAGIVNQGELRSSLGGRVALVGGSVRNDGLIDAPGGQVVLAAGSSVELVDTGAPNLSVRVTAPEGEALNLGTLRAAGGRIDIHAAAVNQLGIVSASSLEERPGGEVMIKASGRTMLANGSRTSAGSAEGQGGRVMLFGQEVGLTGTATVDVSGAEGGGEVLVGGGMQGRDTRYPNARAVYFGPDASIHADATQQGEGGRIVLWSDEATRAHGSLSARGGLAGGNGGFIETSGGWLDARPARIDVSAPKGQAGTWLLDPYNILIADNVSDAGYDASFTAVADDALISTATIVTVLNDGGNVTVSTGAGGTQAGNVTFMSANINVSASQPGSFTVLADGSIEMLDATITSVSPMNITLRSGRSGDTTTPSQVLISNLASISSGGGDVFIGGFDTGINPDGSLFAQAARSSSIGNQDAVQIGGPINVGAGSLTIHGVGVDTGVQGYAAVHIGSALTGDSITIRGYGPFDHGVQINSSTITAGNLTVRGRSDGPGAGASIFNSALSASGSGGFDIWGFSQAYNGVRFEIFTNPSPSLTTTNGAPIRVRGSQAITGLYPAIEGYSFQPGTQPLIDAAGGGNVVFDGHSIAIDRASIAIGSGGLVMSATGDLTLSNTLIDAASRVDLLGSRIELNGATRIASSATGDAIVMAGPGQTGISAGMYNLSTWTPSLPTDPPDVLHSPSGRWIMVMQDRQAPLELGNLDYGFRRYDLDGSWLASDPGNGIVYLSGGVAFASGQVTSRTYDGTTSASFESGLTLVGEADTVGSDTVGLPVGVTIDFADKNVGTLKPMVLSSTTDPLVATDYLGKPVFGYSADISTLGLGSITPLPLLVLGIGTFVKVYDATTAVTLTGTGHIASPVVNDDVSLAGTATGVLVDKNAGTVKPVVLSGLSLTGSDALNYTLQTNTTAQVLPLAIGLSGYVANDKVYDATTVAAVNGAGAISPLAGDVVSLSGGVIGSFADKNVGAGKAVTLGGVSLTGVDAGNYVLSLPTLAAAITPATLTYLAAPASMFLGQPIPTLTGTVTGFLGSDTLSDATTGNLAFSTSAADVRGAGAYPVTGGGLSAVNYGFVQDSGNATALSVSVIGTAPPPSVAAESGVTRGLDPVRRMLQLVEPPKPDPGMSGLAEVVTTPPAVASGALRAGIDNATANFAAFNLGAMSAGEIQFLLDTRDVYKKSIFAAAISKLEADPALADLPPCASLKEAEAGTCLVIESRQPELREALEREQRVAVGTMPPPTQVQPATTAPRPAMPAPAPSPAPAAAPAVAGSATPPAVEAAVAVTAISSSAMFFERRRVRSAALPQIERKVAVLIGVGSYKDAVIPPLANSVGDARAMARLFENQLGYETLVLENVGKSQVAAALNRLALELKPHDSVVIYYAGHGELVRSTKLGYWQLADADSQRPETWLSNSDISRIVAAMPSSQVSLISDSCYSGSLIADDRIRASTAVVDPVALLTRKTVAIMTSGGNEPVFDSGKNGHSPFAYNLMRTLGQVNNWSPGGQVFERVRFAVAREVPQRPQYGASIAAGHQPGGDYLFEQRALER